MLKIVLSGRGLALTVQLFGRAAGGCGLCAETLALLAVGKTKNDLLVVLLDHLIINEKESEGLWWSTAIHVISDSGRRRS